MAGRMRCWEVRTFRRYGRPDGRIGLCLKPGIMRVMLPGEHSWRVVCWEHLLALRTKYGPKNLPMRGGELESPYVSRNEPDVDRLRRW